MFDSMFKVYFNIQTYRCEHHSLRTSLSGLREKREMKERLRRQDETLKWQDETLKQQDERLKRQDERLVQQDERFEQIDERLKQQESVTETMKLHCVQQPQQTRLIIQPTLPMVANVRFPQHNQQQHPANFHQGLASLSVVNVFD